MKHIVAFGGSNSRNSINKKLVVLAANNLKNTSFTILDLNDFEIPLYSIDHENNKGIPEDVSKFNALIFAADGIILSLAEHNGSYTVAFKTLLDWLSRIDKNVWKNKPMLLMSASPGGRGGASVFDTASNMLPRLGANIVGRFSLPFFAKNYSEDKLLDNELRQDFLTEIEKFEHSL
jgi:NAD(P)H-dependent FMN reductase